MAKKDYTHIAVILDRSGSMNSIVSEMCSGFDTFIKKQKEVEGEATVTLAQFDDKYDLVYEMKEIACVPSLTLVPRGTTALLDAMGKTMNTVVERIDGMDENKRPEKCVFVIITDGNENASHEFSREQIFEMIEELRESDEGVHYEFVFIGANQDSIHAGGTIGIRSNSTLNYDANSQGAKHMFKKLSQSMTSYRSADADAAYSFAEDDDDDDGDDDDAAFGAGTSVMTE